MDLIQQLCIEINLLCFFWLHPLIFFSKDTLILLIEAEQLEFTLKINVLNTKQYTVILESWFCFTNIVLKSKGQKCWKDQEKMKEKTNDAKTKWHWGLGLIHMYFRLMVDFISKSHCYAMSVLLQQNEYCILTGSEYIYYVTINENIYICSYLWFPLSILFLSKRQKLNYFVVKFPPKSLIYVMGMFPTFVLWSTGF